MTQQSTGDAPAVPAPATELVLPQLLRAVLPVWVHQIELGIDLSQRTVHQLITSFRAIEAELKSSGIRSVDADLEKIYVGLQYHDRLSQLLQLVSTDAEGLIQAMGANGAPEPGALDPVAWLSRLESRFAMAEQSANPLGNGAVPPGPGIEHF